jgi:hypothetical protein
VPLKEVSGTFLVKALLIKSGREIPWAEIS